MITALIGTIIASVKTSSSGELMQSHFRFQVHTFWIGLLYFVAGSVLLFFYIGAIMLGALAECVAKNEKTYKNFKPALEKIPDAVKDKI